MNGKKKLLVDSVYESIRDGIIKGKYPAGLHLKESELMQEYDVSRVTVRDALRRLEMDELVVSSPNVGVTVRRYDEKTFRNTMIVRAQLEGLAAQLAAENQAADLQELVRIHQEMNAIDSGTMEFESFQNRVDLNHLFHKTVVLLADNDVLYKTWERIDNFVHSFEYNLIMRPTKDSNDESGKEHGELISALLQHDGERAFKVAHDHVLKGLKYSEFFMQWRA